MFAENVDRIQKPQPENWIWNRPFYLILLSGVGEFVIDRLRLFPIARVASAKFVLPFNSRQCGQLKRICAMLTISAAELHVDAPAVLQEEKNIGKNDDNRTGTLRVAIICGGPSAERGISLNSARSVLDHLQVCTPECKILGMAT